jgi:hypothetical protein
MTELGAFPRILDPRCSKDWCLQSRESELERAVCKQGTTLRGVNNLYRPLIDTSAHVLKCSRGKPRYAEQ